MSSPGTVDLLLLRAAANDEITYNADAVHGYVWNGGAVDYDCAAKLYYLARDGYLRIVDEDLDVSPVVVTDAGRDVLR